MLVLCAVIIVAFWGRVARMSIRRACRSTFRRQRLATQIRAAGEWTRPDHREAATLGPGQETRGPGGPKLCGAAGRSQSHIPLSIDRGERALARHPLSPLLMPIVLVTAVAAAFYSLPRSRVPAEVSIVLLAASRSRP